MSFRTIVPCFICAKPSLISASLMWPEIMWSSFSLPCT